MEEEAKRDRISEMPQEIKEQIVSSLCMKDAIGTSSLSSCWRYSWVSLPSLDFGYVFFRKFTSFFRTLPTTHPKKRHLYSVFHGEEEEEEEDDSESTVDDTDDSDFYYHYDYDSDDEYNEWLVKHAWQIDSVEYLHMIDEFFKVYIEKNPSLRGLKKMGLYVPMLSDSKMRDYGADIVSRRLSLVKHNVTELDYWVDNFGDCYGPKDSYYALQNCLPILASKTLTKLELHGCYLASAKKVDVVPIDLPNLKHLRLITFNVGDCMLETLLAKCPALEKLRFVSCKGFKVLRVPRVSKLKKLEVKNTHDVELVEINAMEIQCLSLIDLDINNCKVKMASNSCNNLVNLFVNGCGITDDFFNNVPEFPHLKTLSLIDCPKLKHIKITGNSLRRLDIKECPNLSQSGVDSSKVFFSRYSGSRKNYIKRLFSRPGILCASPF